MDLDRGGHAHGGGVFGRGALYCLLKNRVYVGEIVHKGATYPGQHSAIVPRDLFGAVQTHLQTTRRRTLGKKSTPQDALLAGIIVDEQGGAMVPTYSKKPDGRTYRYYASRAPLMGRSGRAAITRVPSAPIEGLVTEILGRIDLAVADRGTLCTHIRLVQIATARRHVAATR